MEERRETSHHRLIIENRQGGTLTGVRDVNSFDDKEILLLTEEGKLLIKGEDLHVTRLNLEKGEVDIGGRVDSLNYLSKTAGKKEESMLRRMFR